MRLIIICLLFLAGCAVTPESNIQRLYVAQWSVTGAANAVADLKPVLAPSDYEKAANTVRSAAKAVYCARDVAGVPPKAPSDWHHDQCPSLNVPHTTAGYLGLANKLLLEASAYYAAKGE